METPPRVPEFGQSFGWIDNSNPINWNHPLNNGRLMWWRNVGNPGWRGGKTVFDLVRGGHVGFDGTFTGLAWSSNLALPGSVGSWGEFNGTTSVIKSNANWLGQATNKLTVACSVRPFVIGPSRCFNIFNTGTSGTTLEVFLLGFEIAAGAHANFYVSSGTVLAGPATGASTLVTLKWYRIVGTYDGTTISVYVNGVLDGTAASSITLGSGTAQAIRAGFDAAGGGKLTGWMDDCTILNVAWSAQEVRQDYILSRQGYPGVLNYLISNHDNLKVFAAAATTVKFRKTLSLFGSGVGKRQAQGWG